jgi:hypothetical protein
MSDALSALIAQWDAPDPWDYDPPELRDAQYAAATQRLAWCRSGIKVLDRRATDAGIDTVEISEQLIPLLFAHSTYKSYPDSFIKRGNWAGLGRWLDALSVRPVENVAFDGVTDIDEWVARLHGAQHYPLSSSGTTGKPSFVPTTTADHEALKAGYLAGLRAMAGGTPDGTRRAFLAAPKGATTAVQLAMVGAAEDLAGPGRTHYLSDEPMRLRDLNRMGELRQAIADGAATPQEIASFEHDAAARASRMSGQLEAFLQNILAHRGEPLFIAAAYGMLWRIVEVGRAHGLPDNAFHPETVVLCGGGLKGIKAPADFKDQIHQFLGPDVGVLNAYGMSELCGPFAACAEGRYHVPPTTIFLPLDKAGENLLEPSPAGSITCRCAAMDLLVDGRWGGLISGDRVTVEYGPCPCGRRSPALHEVLRYTDLPEGDDKLSCGGSVDAYIRGTISDDAI